MSNNTADIPPDIGTSAKIVMENATTSSQNHVSTVSSSRPDTWPIESQEQLIQVSKQNLYQKFPKKWKDYLMMAAVLGICVTIFSLTVFLALKKYDSGKICTTPECIRSANNLLQSMNTAVEPCDNFYKYACDNWRIDNVMEEPRFLNNWFEVRNKLIKRDIIDFLQEENSDDEPFPVHQARTVYDACLDMESLNEHGLETLWALLDEIGLPYVPLSSEEPRQKWTRTLGKIRRHLGMDKLVGFAVMTSLKNSSLNQLSVATPQESDMFLRRKWADHSTEKALERSLQRGSVDTVQVWKDFSMKVLRFMATRANYTAPDLDRSIAFASINILIMKQNISQIQNTDGIVGPFLNDIPEVVALSQLQELVDNSSRIGESKINWESYFESIFEDIDEVSLNFTQDKIQVYKKPYFELLSEFLDDVTENDIELLLWWEVVYALAPHVHEELKIMKDIYVSRVLSTVHLDPRPAECAHYVYTFMDSAVAYLATTTFDYSLVDTISDMITNIQEAFVESIHDLSWMDGKTKKATVDKVRAMRRFIGIPDWIADGEQLESMYNITLNETTHLENLLTIMKAQVYDTLVALRMENNSSISQFNPLDINAYYDPSGNAISVPAAIMQFPFCDLGLESLNYGALGSILGHEMTHGLDSYGRRFDLHGNLNTTWWSNQSTTEYENRTQCYIKSYSNYYIPLVNGTVDGKITLEENLADDGGLRNAFLAYRRYTKNFELVEKKLPGLEQYSHKQLFFLAHANMWCAEYTVEALSDTLTYDEHSPQFVRVNRVMQNMQDFSKAWNCPVGSKMNPDKKCKLWLD